MTELVQPIVNCEACDGSGWIGSRAADDCVLCDGSGIVKAGEPRIVQPGIVYGVYVNHSGYKAMRLRMLITGTSGPTEAQWSAALTRLLDHLELYPLPEATDAAIL